MDEQTTQTPEADDEKDWQAEYEKAIADLEKVREQSRKWEGRSKSNAEKAKKYDELAAQTMTDAERLTAANARADEAEQRLAAYEAEAKRAKAAAEVAEAYGVPVSLLVGDDRDAMEAHAKAIRAFAENRPAAEVFKSDGRKPAGEGKARTPKQDFADYFASKL